MTTPLPAGRRPAPGSARSTFAASWTAPSSLPCGGSVALATVLALVLGLAAPAAGLASDKGSFTLGFRGGSITTTLANNEFDTFHVGPMLEASYGDVSLGFGFLWGEFDANNQFDFFLPQALVDAGAPDSLSIDTAGGFTRFDYDISLRYRLHEYVTPFIGYRKEIFDNVQFKIDLEDPALLAQVEEIGLALLGSVLAGDIGLDDLQNAVDGLAPVSELNFDLELDLLAIGAGFAYPLHDIGLIPVFVATLFPYVSFEGEGESYPGFALEGGFAYLLGRHLDLPLYLTATVKFQRLDLEQRLERLDEVAPGVSEQFALEEENLTTNFALFYRFDLGL